MGEVTVRGKILDKDSRELRSGKTIIIFHITDFTDTITVKVFANEDTLEDLNAAIKPGTFIRLCGMTTIDRFDGELTIGSVRGIKKAEDFTSKRMDHSPVKRVELHCHTKMSDMDGVSDVASIIKKAKEWGMELWLSRIMAVCRPSRRQAMLWIRMIRSRCSMAWRDTWWMT